MSVNVAAPEQADGALFYFADADVEPTGARRRAGWPWARDTVTQYRITYHAWRRDWGGDTGTCWAVDEAAALRCAQARMKRMNDRFNRLVNRPGGCDCGHCGFCRP